MRRLMAIFCFLAVLLAVAQTGCAPAPATTNKDRPWHTAPMTVPVPVFPR